MTKISVTLVFRIFQIEYPNGTLKIMDVSKSDEGLYVCAVSNTAGTVQAETYLKVLGNGQNKQMVVKAFFFY